MNARTLLRGRTPDQPALKGILDRLQERRDPWASSPRPSRTRWIRSVNTLPRAVYCMARRNAANTAASSFAVRTVSTVPCSIRRAAVGLD